MKVLTIVPFALVAWTGLSGLQGALAACPADPYAAYNACLEAYNITDSQSLSFKGDTPPLGFESLTCDQMNGLSNCVGLAESCEDGNAWYNTYEILQKLWANKTCTTPTFGELDTARSALSWGDPHLIMFNGTYQSCQNNGWYPMATGKHWNVYARLQSFNDSVSDGTVIDYIQVNFLHPAYPDTFEWSLDFLPTPNVTQIGSNEDNWLTVTEDSVSVPAMGLKVFANRKSGHFQLGIVAKTVLSGLLVNGCASYSGGVGARSFNVADIPTECADLPSGYQEGCTFDLARSNGTWASEGASEAQAFSSVTLAAEVAKQNGAKSQAFGPSGYLAIATISILAAVIALF